ncbi:branched-chain amino acid ABC transporter permease [Candidatus Bathyarchaeota archaeon]|nr:branched-chain amino acid ABC transporter permease [Candidatus Bathyarchaeota archaeon]
MKISIDKKHLPLILAAIVIFGLPLLPVSPYIIHIFTIIYLFAFFSTCWNILGGFAGTLSLGHTAFVGIGAYLTYFMFTWYGLSPWIGMLLAALASIGLATILGYPCFKFGVRGTYFALATIAFAEILRDLCLYYRDITGGALGLYLRYLGFSPLNFQFNDKRYFCYIAIFLWLLSLFITYRMKRFRYKLIAIREDEDAAAALGINVLKEKMVALWLSAFLTAIGGAFWLQYYRCITPGTVLSLDLSIQIALIAIFGGMYDIIGPTVGAVVLMPISEMLRVHLGGTYAGLHLLIYGVLLIVVLLFMPKGLTGIIKKYFIRKEEE